MKRTPPGHSWVKTQDGSWTLFSEKFEEACHSLFGALSESTTYYVQGCEVEERFRQNGSINILEVGFGLGMGLLATWNALAAYPGEVTFVSLELDENLLEWFRSSSEEFTSFTWITDPVPMLTGRRGNFTVHILKGDARHTLPTFQRNSPIVWDAIYQDAFSPKKNTSLWTREWFEVLKAGSSPDVILSTYSASSSIRKSLLEAGWTLQEGGMFGSKRASTRARLKGPTAPEILERIGRSPVPSLKDIDL